jgi:very-short-patch-repair endonuclease
VLDEVDHEAPERRLPTNVQPQLAQRLPKAPLAESHLAAQAPGLVPRARRLRREMTLSERRLWEALRKLRLNIRRQAPLGRFVVDFVQHTAKLVIEVDGAYWHGTVEAQARDAQRDASLEAQGYLVLRIADELVGRDLDGVVAEVRSRVLSRVAARPSPPSDPGSPGHLPPSRGKGVD